MVEAIRLIQSYVDGISREEFFADKKMQQAVVMNILIPGETATQVGNEYPEWADQHPEVPWRSTVNARHEKSPGSRLLRH
jgi:uncharacterized protein with HEPN domain